LENIFPLDADAGDIAPGGECPFLGQEAWVASDGRFNPCCAPDALRRTLWEFGNLNAQRLPEIWESSEYRDLRENYMGKPLCRGCNMRRPVNGQP
jgi:radical SAM protein with 4Fe4S-binding SPASM domain